MRESGLLPKHLEHAFVELSCNADEPKVNLVLLEFSARAVFAGVKTALEVAVIIAHSTGRCVRILIVLKERSADLEIQSDLAWLKATYGAVDWEILYPDEIREAEYSPADIWVVTHWATAHSLQFAVDQSTVQRSRVLYLIQDYEPLFEKNAAVSELSASTYNFGFTRLVNSVQVDHYLAAQGYGFTDERQVFSPRIDFSTLQEIAMTRVRGEHPLLFFYGRPSKPRNMFDLGVQALRFAAPALLDRWPDLRVIMAGEHGKDIVLSEGLVMENLGVLERREYFRMIAEVDLGLALQETPHPSHIPFDLAYSGAHVVVNDLSGARSRIHDRILLAPADAEGLGQALVDGMHIARQDSPNPLYGPSIARDALLGANLEDSVAYAVSKLGD